MIISSWLRALLVLPSLIAATPIVKRDFPAAGACSGDCEGHVHDPSVVYNGKGTYYRFTTNDKVNIATAPSIAGPWTHQGSALPGGSIINLPGNNDIWAPDVFFYAGTYYMYYAVSAPGSQNSDIGVATSPSMDAGSWTDHGSIGIPANSAWNKIDPNLFQHDANAPFFLSFGSYWDDIFQVPMQTPPLSVAGGNINHLEFNSTLPHYNEGSFQFWWQVGGISYYYLFFSSGFCCNTANQLAPPGDEYKIMVCRSDNPNGGFRDQNGNDCLTQNGGTLVYGSNSNDVYAPGGQGVFYDPNQNSFVMHYHYIKPSVGYDYTQFFFGWNKLDFSSGWPVVVP